MPCETYAPGVTICSSPYVRTAQHCPTEGRVRPMAGVFGLMYGSTLTCLGCGDTYDSDEPGFRRPRPFMRNWQAKRIRKARDMWRNAAPLKQEIERQHEEWRAA